jgi:UDP-N-acetylglucosamine diphosphorylase / glucose-1-phosphate thymidylyltransferase / UDP-N-acetylgalactosamine diphosphorylase / glucosamine-1-phosphate N-acetyltransferase / galactosamine-1-phosphate N-acetyltransferase
MKALILAGGKGSRLRDQPDAPPKPLLQVGSKRLMDFSLQNAANAGVSEIIVVVSYFTEAVINHYGSQYRGIPITYKIQNDPRGLVHAIECAAGAIGTSDFILMLADEVFLNIELGEMIKRFRDEKLFAVLGVVEVQDRSQISKTYSILEDSGTGRIHRLVEKPRRPHNSIMGTGNCVFANAMLSYIDLTPVNQTRGEKELPDLIQCAVDDGQPVKMHRVGERYINVNAMDDFKAAFALLEQHADSF